MTLMIDPPSGWRYGFPKPAPPEGVNLKDWLVENGYPERDADFALQYMRYFNAEKEND